MWLRLHVVAAALELELERELRGLRADDERHLLLPEEHVLLSHLLLLQLA